MRFELHRNFERIEGSEVDDAKVEQTPESSQNIDLVINLIESWVTQISEGNSKTTD